VWAKHGVAWCITFKDWISKFNVVLIDQEEETEKVEEETEKVEEETEKVEEETKIEEMVTEKEEVETNTSKLVKMVSVQDSSKEETWNSRCKWAEMATLLRSKLVQ